MFSCGKYFVKVSNFFFQQIRHQKNVKEFGGIDDLVKTPKHPKVPQSNLIAVVKLKFERMFVFGFFFPISLSHATKKLDIYLLLLVAVSHCDKKNFVCRTEPLRQTDFLLVAQSHCDKQSLYMFHKKGPKLLHFLVLFAMFGTFCYFLAFCMPFFVFFAKSLHTLVFCVQYIPILFVAVTQCDKQKIHLSQ